MIRLLGLRSRLTVAFVLVGALVFGVVAALVLGPLDHRLTTQARHNLYTTAISALPAFLLLPEKALRDLAQPEPPRGQDHRRGGAGIDREIVFAAIRDLRRRANAEVSLFDSYGKHLGPGDVPSGTSELVARAFAAHRPQEALRSDEGLRVAEVVVPFRLGGLRYAYALTSSLEPIEATERAVRRGLLTAGLVGLAVVVLVAWLLGARLATRLERLRDTMHAVAEEGPSAPVPHDPVRDEIGDLTASFARMQQRLQAQEQSRRTFVSTASHELRTPLASLVLTLETIRDNLRAQPPELEEAREEADSAVAQTSRLTALAQSLLDLSRVDAQVPLRSEPVEVCGVARAVVAELPPGSGPAIESEPPVWALSDPGATMQIVRLLVDNARRHGRGTQARIAIDRDARTVRIRVSDEGPGVAPQDEPILFERFARGRNVTVPGSGLGLAIGRELAQRMGGDLVHIPAARGAEFLLTLPTPEAKPPAA